MQVALASSFVNRVTPANVGGMALNVRYMQKAGIPPAEAVTGVGLNVVAGGIVHVVLLIVFFAWARQGDAAGFSVPGGSKLLVAIPVVLAARRDRHGDPPRPRVRSPARASRRCASHCVSIATVARSPARLAALFGGSIGVTLAYITALACTLTAFDAGLSYAEVGAVYLGASLIAAAAPTPGGLGALEAALVAGCTGLGVDPSIAVAAVLSYRLLTFWLPILPGWLCFHLARPPQLHLTSDRAPDRSTGELECVTPLELGTLRPGVPVAVVSNGGTSGRLEGGDIVAVCRIDRDDA